MAMRDPSPDGAVDSTDFSVREGHVPSRLRFLHTMRNGLAAAARAALHIVYPPQCVACEGGTDAPHALCPTCWREMPFISRPYCARLGTPFAVDFGASMLSPAAIADPPRFDAARAVALHDGVAKELVSRFKYGERLDLARFMAPLMVKAGQEVLTGAQVLVPVPMHPRRLFARRYNQAALLAQAIGRETGIPVSLDMLRRARHTPQQVGLNRAARRSNLAGAFRLAPEAEMVFAGAHAVLVDDVRTTGATLNACAHMLRKAGAKRVDVLTFTLVPDQGIIG
jgi:ComF family protein